MEGSGLNPGRMGFRMQADGSGISDFSLGLAFTDYRPQNYRAHKVQQTEADKERSVADCCDQATDHQREDQEDRVAHGACHAGCRGDFVLTKEIRSRWY